MAKVIKTTSDYELLVGNQLDEPHAKCYQLVNRLYDVIEAETQILPQAFEYMEQIQAALDARRDDEKAVSDAIVAASDSAVASISH